MLYHIEMVEVVSQRDGRSCMTEKW